MKIRNLKYHNFMRKYKNLNRKKQIFFNKHKRNKMKLKLRRKKV